MAANLITTFQSPYNLTLEQRRQALARAWRGPIAPGCSLPAVDKEATAQVQRKSLVYTTVNAQRAGENVLIPSLIGTKYIHEILLWNVDAQTLQLWQGLSPTGIMLLQLTTFPAMSMFYLPFSGDFAQPHFVIDPGQQFTLQTQSAGVDGFIRYRNQNASGNF